MDFKIMNSNLTSYNSVIGKEDYSIVSIVVFTGFFLFFSNLVKPKKWLAGGLTYSATMGDQLYIPSQTEPQWLETYKPLLCTSYLLLFWWPFWLSCLAWEERLWYALFYVFWPSKAQISLQFFFFQRFTTFTSVILSLFVGGSTLSKCC